jgi:hypothetical protein
MEQWWNVSLRSTLFAMVESGGATISIPGELKLSWWPRGYEPHSTVSVIPHLLGTPSPIPWPYLQLHGQVSFIAFIGIATVPWSRDVCRTNPIQCVQRACSKTYLANVGRIPYEEKMRWTWFRKNVETFTTLLRSYLAEAIFATEDVLQRQGASQHVCANLYAASALHQL